MNRTHMWLGVVLAVQVLLILLFRGPLSGGGERGDAGTLLPELESMTAQRIEITDGTGQSVVLARDGDAWTVQSLDGYPADTEKVNKALAALGEVNGRRPVVSSGRYHAALKVGSDAFERRVRIWGEGERDAEAELFIGTSPNYQVSHVRRGGDDHVYEGQGVSAFDMPAGADAWANRKLVDLTVDAVSSIEVANRHGRFALEQREGHWSVKEPSARASRSLDQEKVASLVRLLAPLYVSEAAGRRDASHGMDRPAATVTLRVGPHPEEATAIGAAPPSFVTLQVGAEKPGADGLRYAGVDGSDFSAVIAKATADKLLEQRLNDLFF